MALVDMVMPKMGESIMECTVITWLKKPGDRIEADESILEVATDKVDTEVPASHSGILKEVFVNDGDVVPIGKPIARIEIEQEAGDEPTPTENPDYDTRVSDELLVPETVEAAAQELEAGISAMSTRQPEPVASGSVTYGNRFYSPLVLSIAKEEGISAEELTTIPGTGAESRVTKKDILAYVQQRKKRSAAATQPTSTPPAGKPVTQPEEPAAPAPKAISVNGQSDIIQMDRMRKMIAQRMVESKQISPHVSSFVEADMTPVVQWRNAVKEDFKRQTGENLTFTPILIEAVVKAIKDFPMINISVEGDNIIVKKPINIGMAVALPNGNLIVPVIHEADQYNLIGLTKKVNDLSKRARENKLTGDDLANGTYTISNIGTFGNIMGTPIILQPQVAIMAFGAIQKKPAVIETPQGDLIGIRQMMFLSHSYDHRVVDGSLGGQFVRRVADYLENFDTNRTL
ncbi:dihydrolipoamide acetyltransferase family protein [Nibrella viscosa]|uniref:Dihydrolipoamide acetyltransferase component of pyruvate dehydrogenase complex n=1 Tax=Nibrella viscosa TaxID=1084524 RepID=A0ABP8KM79_9BACT